VEYGTTPNSLRIFEIELRSRVRDINGTTPLLIVRCVAQIHELSVTDLNATRLIVDNSAVVCRTKLTAIASNERREQQDGPHDHVTKSEVTVVEALD
jgi:hypothetical protein